MTTGKNTKATIKNEYQKVWSLPKLVFSYDWEDELKANIAYSSRNYEVLKKYKYDLYAGRRPVDPVYALACFLHTNVQYYGLGYNCTGDGEDYDGEDYQYNGLPDDLSLLMAHSVLVLGDKKRFEALQKIRSIVREFTNTLSDRTHSFEEALLSNAHFNDC